MIGGLFRQMLEKNAAVYLPEIGVFTLHYRAAEIAFADRTVASPTFEVDFVPGNPGSGVSSFLELAEHQYPGVSKHISPLLVQLKEDLKSNKRAVLPGFGKFEWNYEGQLVFMPEKTLVSHSNYWGLPVVSAETLASRNRSKMDREVPVIPLHPFDTNREETPSSTRKFWFRPMAASAVACALIAAVSGVYWLSGFSGDSKSNFQVVQAQEAALVPAVGRSSSPVAQKTSKVLVPAAEIRQQKQSKPSPEEKPATFKVIAGSFRDPLKASVRKAELEALGFLVETIPGSDPSWTRVSIGEFSDKEIALAFVNQEKEKHHADFWILRNAGN